MIRARPSPSHSRDPTVRPTSWPRRPTRITVGVPRIRYAPATAPLSSRSTGKVRPCCVTHRGNGSPGLAEVDRQDGQTLVPELLVDRLERRGHLPRAEGTPGRPEVQHDHPASLALQRDPLAGEIGKGHGGRLARQRPDAEVAHQSLHGVRGRGGAAERQAREHQDRAEGHPATARRCPVSTSAHQPVHSGPPRPATGRSGPPGPGLAGNPGRPSPGTWSERTTPRSTSFRRG